MTYLVLSFLGLVQFGSFIIDWFNLFFNYL